MSPFISYLKLGLWHIADINAYDHILFIVALCAMYTLQQWKQVLLLVTAFTIGHSLTLALAGLSIVSFSTVVIELLIPITIILTALFNIYQTKKNKADKAPQNIHINYLLALFFGLIHGLGFSNFFSSLMGKDAAILQPLLAFNIGIELGQLVIVVLVLLVSFLAVGILGISQRRWNLGVSVGVGLVACWLLVQLLQ